MAQDGLYRYLNQVQMQEELRQAAVREDAS